VFDLVALGVLPEWWRSKIENPSTSISSSLLSLLIDKNQDLFYSLKCLLPHWYNKIELTALVGFEQLLNIAVSLYK
jgi:hypothetical protein